MNHNNWAVFRLHRTRGWSPPSSSTCGSVEQWIKCQSHAIARFSATSWRKKRPTRGKGYQCHLLVCYANAVMQKYRKIVTVTHLIHLLLLPVAEALKNFQERLTELEQEEIMDYAEIWFLGLGSQKIEASQDAPQNSGYDDEHGSYIRVMCSIMTPSPVTLTINSTKVRSENRIEL